MTFFLKNNQNNQNHHQTEWMIIDIFNIFTKQYNNMKTKYNIDLDNLDDDCMILLFEQIQNKIQNLLKDKNNNYVVVLVNDNIVNNQNLWRTDVLEKWTDKYGFKYYDNKKRQIWAYVFDYYLSDFIKKEKYIYFNNDMVEFIDIVAIITKYIEHNYSGDKIKIISSDSDFYQLINDNVSVLNMNGDEDVSRILSSGDVNLWFKIIKGVKNISLPVQFNISFINYFLKTNDEQKWVNINDQEYIDSIITDNTNMDNFRELNKQELYYFLHNLNIFKKILTEHPNYILNEQHIINKQLIDFNNIPYKQIELIEAEFKNLYNKIYNHFNDKNKTNNNCINEKINSKMNSKMDNKVDNKINNTNNRFAGLEIDE